MNYLKKLSSDKRIVAYYIVASDDPNRAEGIVNDKSFELWEVDELEKYLSQCALSGTEHKLWFAQYDTTDENMLNLIQVN